KFPLFHNIFIPINQANTAISKAATAGTSFVFGFLGGGPQPFTITNPSAGLILAFQVLPLVLVISALSSLLFYWRILPLIVRGLAWILQHTLGIGGALGLATAANVFVGMVEAPLFIRPYLKAMTRGELFAVMTAGMATVAGTVMLLYAKILTSVIPNAINHIVTASIISAPAALTIAAIMVPLGNTATAGNIINVNNAQSSMDAITRGTMDGLNLFLNILALLLVLVALVDLSNQIIGLLPNMYDQPITIQRILGWIMAPLMWLIGIPWAEAQTAGTLMGTKTVLNELLAYLDLSQLPTNALSTRSRLIIIYALCGFANFGSLGIMLGGMGTMVPERRTEIISLGVKSMLSGTLATCMTGAVVGLIV
ncbi:nucleoside:proton symporter, partial [Achromatium sp. WMS2]